MFLSSLVNSLLFLSSLGLIYGWSVDQISPVSGGIVVAIAAILQTFGILRGIILWGLCGVSFVMALGGVAYVVFFVAGEKALPEQERKAAEEGFKDEQEKVKSTTSDRPIAMYMTVRRQFEAPGTSTASSSTATSTPNNASTEAETSQQGAGAVTEAWSNSSESRAARAIAQQAGNGQSSSTTMGSKAYTMLSSTLQKIQERSTSPSGSGSNTPKEDIVPPGFAKEVWVKLSGTVLYLYEDHTEKKHLGVLPTRQFIVSIDNGAKSGAPKMKEGELFNKKNALVLTPLPHKKQPRERSNSYKTAGKPKPSRRSTKSSINSVDTVASEATTASTTPIPTTATTTESKEDLEARRKRQERREIEHRRALAESQPWYLFPINPTQCEIWYHALLQASANPPTMDEIFPKENWGKYVDTLEGLADPTMMHPLNALLGRLFMAYCPTEFLQSFIIEKIHAKLRKTKMHWMVGDITMRSFDIGTMPPVFSKMSLKEANKDGSISLAVDVKFQGEASMVIGTQLQYSVGFGGVRKAPPVEAKATLRSLSGTLLIKIYPPPSNRFWYGFVTFPELDLKVEPTFNSVSLAHPALMGQIDKLIRKGMAGAIVLPNMDDVPFFNTANMEVRGGIFDAARRQADDSAGSPVVSTVTNDGPGVAPARKGSVASAAEPETAPIVKAEVAADSVPTSEGFDVGRAPAQADVTPPEVRPSTPVKPAASQSPSAPSSPSTSQLPRATTLPSLTGDTRHRVSSSTSSSIASGLWQNKAEGTTKGEGLSSTSAATLIESFRAQAGDKEQLQRRLNIAKDRMQGWGKAWNLKKSGTGEMEPEMAVRERGVEDALKGVQSALAKAAHPKPEPGRSKPVEIAKTTPDAFQQRLAAAATLASSPERVTRTTSSESTRSVPSVKEQPHTGPSMAVPRIPVRSQLSPTSLSSSDPPAPSIPPPSSSDSLEEQSRHPDSPEPTLEASPLIFQLDTHPTLTEARDALVVPPDAAKEDVDTAAAMLQKVAARDRAVSLSIVNKEKES